MDFLSKGYTAIVGSTTGPAQTLDDTVSKLTDRLASATLAEDRRASVLALKGLAKDYRKVGCCWLQSRIVDTVLHRHSRWLERRVWRRFWRRWLGTRKSRAL